MHSSTLHNYPFFPWSERYFPLFRLPQRCLHTLRRTSFCSCKNHTRDTHWHSFPASLSLACIPFAFCSPSPRSDAARTVLQPFYPDFIFQRPQFPPASFYFLFPLSFSSSLSTSDPTQAFASGCSPPGRPLRWWPGSRSTRSRTRPQRWWGWSRRSCKRPSGTGSTRLGAH